MPQAKGKLLNLPQAKGKLMNMPQAKGKSLNLHQTREMRVTEHHEDDEGRELQNLAQARDDTARGNEPLSRNNWTRGAKCGA